MTPVERAISEWPGWTMVVSFDGELVCMDASTQMAERILETKREQVIGIYLPDQWGHLQHDLRARA